eukprot:Anaeramoba_ignava/a358811_57.p1 GENE.a358811_57~~a358811_57.p1  ORF type:complete len:174 (+),score=54.70 a358811_57:32-553(+)
MGNSKSKVAPHKEFYKPTGMYPKIEWDQKTIRTRIKKKQLAPIYPLQTNKMDSYIEECPICFYRFPSINRTKCCDKPICTECFLQITPKYPTNENKCPFCQASHFSVKYCGIRQKQEIEKEEEIQRKIEEAHKKSALVELEVFNKQKEEFQKKLKEEIFKHFFFDKKKFGKIK